MSGIFGEHWIWWAVGFAVGIPLLLVILTEILGVLTRRGSAAAGPVRLLRNWVVPVGALLALFGFAQQSPSEHFWARVTATIFGALLILLVLSAFNSLLFKQAKVGSWRERVPSIFIELVRLLLVVVGLGLLFSWVWGADIGGLITALGVTSIVIGLALQNAVGGIISGLLLLFEQPFQIGDYLDVGGVKGRVVEVNWRSAHIDTGSGIQIIPNGSLAGQSFKNLSEPTGPFMATTSVKFSTDDPPYEVINLLTGIAEKLPQLSPEESAKATYTGNGGYDVEIPLSGPAVVDDAISQYMTWLWYASRRLGFALDGDATDPIATSEKMHEALDYLTPVLHLTDKEREGLDDKVRLLRFSAGETVVEYGIVPTAVYFILSGSCVLSTPAKGGGELEYAYAYRGESLGSSGLMRQKALTSATAVDEVTVLAVPLPVLDDLVRAHPKLAAELGDAIELRRKQAIEAMAEVSSSVVAESSTVD